jgi:large subunit ribosomal protein L4
MPKIQVKNIAGKEVREEDLSEVIFGAKSNDTLLHQVYVALMSNLRKAIAHTKDRGERRGGGKKPWKQKGTGRARHGSSRSPIWKGGGVTHGPRAEKVYAVKINKKMRLAALASVLSRKLQDGEIIFVDSLAFKLPKTKEAVTFLGALAKASGRSELATKRKNAAVIALMAKDANIEKSFSNIGSLMTQEVRNLNPVEIMNKKFLVIEKPAESIKILQSRFVSKAVTGETA